jgi:hypothetical protein
MVAPVAPTEPPVPDEEPESLEQAALAMTSTVVDTWSSAR